MTVMDMTPVELFKLLEPERKARNLKAITVKRCGKCHHFQIGTYEFRGKRVVIIGGFRYSPAWAAQLGLSENKIPGRAWAGPHAPSGQMYGCSCAAPNYTR